MKNVIIIICMFICCNLLFSYEIVEIVGENINRPSDLCVLENKIIISDTKLKLYDLSNNQARFNNFISGVEYSGFCKYENDKLYVLDFKNRKIIIYNNNFNKIGEVECLRLAYDFYINNGRLIISGYKEIENEHYDLYYYDNNIFYPLLESYKKYGFKNKNEYEYKFKSGVYRIGRQGFITETKEKIYFIWEGDLTNIFINGRKKRINPGKKYIKPKLSVDYLRLHVSGNVEEIISAKRKMSYVRGLFSTQDNIFIIYELENDFFINVYNLNMKLIKKTKINGSYRIDFNNNIFYFLKKIDNQFKVIKYSIEEIL